MTNKWAQAIFNGVVFVLAGTVILEMVRPGSVVLYVSLYWLIGALVVTGLVVVMTKSK